MTWEFTSPLSLRFVAPSTNQKSARLYLLFIDPTHFDRFNTNNSRMNLNISLTFEVVLYLNSYYFGLFFVCELGMNAVKYINFSSLQHYSTDFSVLIGVCLVEILRVILARRGNLTEKSK